MKLLTNTDRGVPGPVTRNTTVGFVSVELVAMVTAKNHQQPTIAEKRPPILQVFETTALLAATRCRQFHNDHRCF